MIRQGGEYRDNEGMESIFHSFGTKTFSDSLGLAESSRKYLPF
jgi:hypothetical protein